MNGLLLCLPLLASPAPRFVPQSDYAADLEFALDALEETCGALLESKGIDWKKVRSEFRPAVKDVSSDEEHHLLLQRLLARLEDGHCAVRPGPKGQWR